MSTATPQPGKSPKIKHLPLQDLGLNNLVAVPYILSLSEPLHTALRVGLRQVESLPAQYGLSNSYTINGKTATAYEFMYGKKPSQLISLAIKALEHSLISDGEDVFKAIYDPKAEFHKQAAVAPPPDPSSLTQLSMDSPEQYAMAWTRFEGIDELGKPYLPDFVASLTDADAATRQFWPTIGNYSFVHNFIVLEKVGDALAESIRQRFGDAWISEGMETPFTEGNLYALDLTVFDVISSTTPTASGRYTHATFTVLRRDAKTKALEPVAVWVSGKNVDGRPRIYTRSKAAPGAWLYALQAVKVCVTVSGIFLRHVYLWHVVPAVMQMTMYNTLPDDHPLYQMLSPQMKYTIALDETLLLLWQAGKPSSSLDTALEYLRLCNEFAKDRKFYDDDPKVAIERLGLKEEDFSASSPWDQYATVNDSLELWDATEKYAGTCADTIYADDQAVANDGALHAWIAAASSPDQGNVQGLEPPNDKPAVKRFLTSLLYRIIAHGGTNMVFPTFIAHLFGSNFPVCLQRRDIPEPDANLETKQLLTYLPNCETIGLITGFYFGFAFVKPAESFVPKDGVDTNLFYPSGLKDPRNRALVEYRGALVKFVNTRALLPNIIDKWPLNVES